ncbi:valine--tRNA ligase, mitochondrial-like [Orussus abietinus]|uniref:valine--tRNA ligase, mitochondrial-like n=1 Tax=Orussus abietinus TaxID=222816 RepID=UPI0006256660|nr:valine--tRNA ligase, mitochondrial-like [Orussus abietinus]XP_012279472.1 valine--tRNA ligase, mitochondrial-like [Orussus abietinus]
MKRQWLNLLPCSQAFSSRTYSSEQLAHCHSGFPEIYHPKAIESGWYEKWEKNEYFTPKKGDKEPFKIILPPPNVTGTLHLGHALTGTIQDVLARWHRMKKHPVVWIPGLDHAGIATQVVVEKILQSTRGASRLDMGREKFLSEVWQWKEQNENMIKKQLKTMGFTLDWSREFFTMNKDHNKAVVEAFIMLHKRNMIYRDKDMVNWSPALRSVISDIEIEVERITKKTFLEIPGYNKKIPFGQIVEVLYKIKGSENEIIVATTRPESMLGDVAIAVHPDDERYSKYVGCEVWHPLKKLYIPIIADSIVDPEFGTGAVKITPAHDRTDYAIAKRHNLEIIDVIDEHGNISTDDDRFKGLPRYVAREKILHELANLGALKQISNHEMLIPRCSRTGDVIENLLREQWFVKCKSMAERAMQVVHDGSLKIDPAFCQDSWFEWLNNIKDWCISRQIWWGHRIPAYRYQCGTDINWIVAHNEEEARRILTRNKNDAKLEQDTDVLDTWFSSALLPFSSMGWPNKISDYNDYYPLTMMETGNDIIFFWVTRMVMMGLELTNQLPFKEILLHGVLCDGQGKKMSKSLGNVISPENVINGITLKDLNEQAEQSFKAGILSHHELKRTLAVNAKMFPDGILDCGVDALRLTLCAHNIKERRINFNIIECVKNKHFCNKILQACKYTLRVTDEFEASTNLHSIDLWILSRLSLMVTSVNKAFAERHFYRAVSAIKQFLYYEFCDFYLEATKVGFKSDNLEMMNGHRNTLVKCLEVSLRILAPLTPYLCDEFYTKLSPKLPGFLSLPSLTEAPYPVPSEFEDLRDISLEEKFNEVLEVINRMRSISAGINRKLKPEVHIVVHSPEDSQLYAEHINVITATTKIENIKVLNNCEYAEPEESIRDDADTRCRLFLVLDDKVALQEAKKKIEKIRLEAGNKLNRLLKTTSVKKYSEDSEDCERGKDKEMIKSLEEELKRLPRTG